MAAKNIISRNDTTIYAFVYIFAHIESNLRYSIADHSLYVKEILKMKRPKEEEGECRDCGTLTNFKGWHYVHPEKRDDPLIREDFFLCPPHYIMKMFNLLPFQCTDECRKERGKVLGIHLRKDDTIVWLDLTTSMEPGGPPVKIGIGESFPLVPSAATCPWCQEPMKAIKDIKEIYD